MTEVAPSIPPTLTQRVAAEVRAEVARRHTKQEELAALLGVGQPSISRRLNGKFPFDTDELDKLAAYFGVPVDQFLFAPAVAGVA